ncbi:helix-turn-helix domain-containing protein [Flavobacterium sp. KDG-16]|uniref:Helix-turn-helix domain-containing protein n=2 Tax=Flavobacterium difficile TaxID=2709659 RepID=A0ABX0I5F6_9FLAO|nr:helix-turn-helix domain-containing protein [Flavobacterium difficile]
MQNSLLVHNIDVLQFQELLKETLKTQLEELKTSLKEENQDELLTREETYQFLKIDSSTLWEWTRKGKLIVYGIGNRKYYKKREVLDCLTKLNS